MRTGTEPGRRRTSRFAAAALALVALAGCTSEEDDPWIVPPGPVGAPEISIDSPEMREVKAAAGISDCANGSAREVENGLPTVEVPCLGGGPNVDLSTLDGPLLVNLWASWCGPCREELPVLQEFDEKYGDQVGVVGIAYKETDGLAALDLAADSGVTYPLLAEVDGYLETLEAFPLLTRGIPYSVLIDADGEIVFRGGLVFRELDDVVDLVDDNVGLDR